MLPFSRNDGPSSARGRLRRLHRLLLGLLVVYFFAGSASQKLIPGVDEIFPFFGWSLFSKVPAEQVTYAVLLREQNGKALEGAVSYLEAPDSIAAGNRFIARKVIQSLGEAQDRGNTEEAARLRKLFEENYLHGRVRYELLFERYDPLHKWRRGENLESRSLGVFGPEAPPAAAKPAEAVAEPPRRGRWRKRPRPKPDPAAVPEESP